MFLLWNSTGLFPCKSRFSSQGQKKLWWSELHEVLPYFSLLKRQVACWIRSGSHCLTFKKETSMKVSGISFSLSSHHQEIEISDLYCSGLWNQATVNTCVCGLTLSLSVKWGRQLHYYWRLNVIMHVKNFVQYLTHGCEQNSRKLSYNYLSVSW